MITQFFLNLIFTLLHFLITFLPNPDTLPTAIDDAFEAIAPYWGTASYYFPVSVLFTIIGLGVTLELGILGFKVANWGLNKVRGAG